MANPLSGLNLSTLSADIAKVEEVIAVVEKYEGYLPLPAAVKTGIADLDKALKFAESVLNDI